jgi:large repetitive protein
LTIYPSAIELCDGLDNDCDSILPTNETDDDNDGYVDCTIDTNGWDGSSISGGDDCDDIEPSIYPGADEYCDGSDNNCDGSIDENTAIDASIWYLDTDGDGYGDSSNTVIDCSQPTNYTSDGTDCNDSDNSIYTSAPELCDGIINDCNTNILPTTETDDDGDGYVDCSIDANGWDGSSISGGDDCDDAENTVYPNAIELCDGLDNDCNSVLPSNEIDDDSDGYVECTIDSNGWDGSSISGGNDCDDTNGQYYVISTWYLDFDFDGYGNSSLSLNSCSPLFGYIADNSDCDDTDNTVYPNAAEVCDGQINDCNSTSVPTNETDDDSDGFVDCTIDANGWDGGPIFGGDDCNDTDDTLYPNATELCDGLINDCNTANLSSTETDDDADGYVECTIDSNGWDGSSISGGDDCDDTDSTAYPAATELCDGTDNNCDLTLPSNETDDDADGYVECTIDANGWDGSSISGGDDCDDADGFTHPYSSPMESSPELCRTDADGDNYGDDSPSPSVYQGTDCDDSDPNLNPSTNCPDGLSCKDILDAGLSQGDGNYNIDPDGSGGVAPFSVYCDMTTDGGGWTEIPYIADLNFQQHFSNGDAWRWLPFDFQFGLSDAQISAIQSVSTDGYQEYVGLCDHVIHYYYNSGSSYAYSFGFEFFDGTQTNHGSSSYSPNVVSIIQDGCAQNGGENGSVALSTIFAFETVLVPIRNVECRDCGNSFPEEFGSPLIDNPAWLR